MPGLLLVNSLHSGWMRGWTNSSCSMDLLFLLHCLTSGNCSTLHHKATKIYATCDLSQTYRPAHSRGVLGNSLSVDIRGSSAQLSPAQRLALQNPTRFACSGSGLCLFSSAGMPCSAWAPALCAVIGKLSPGRKWASRGARLVSYAAVLELQSYTVCRLLSKTAASCILLSFIVVYWKGLVQYQLFIMDGHFLQSLFFFSCLFSVWTGISLGDTGGQNEE